jgi:hypothetical protein
MLGHTIIILPITPNDGRNPSKNQSHSRDSGNKYLGYRKFSHLHASPQEPHLSPVVACEAALFFTFTTSIDKCSKFSAFWRISGKKQWHESFDVD